MFPTLLDEPPEGGDWIHEIKFDDYRSQIVIDNGDVRIFTRRGHDWTTKYAPIAAEAGALDVERAIIDGEMVLADETGLTHIGKFRSAIGKQPEKLIFMAFDLLHLDDHDLRPMAVEERRHLLKDLIQPGGRIQFSEELEGDAKDIFRRIDRAGLEGMVSKRLGSRYRSGDTTEWVKAKCFDTADFEIIGAQREKGKPAMVLMANKGGQYVGGAFVTFRRRSGSGYGRAFRKGQGRSRRPG